MPACAISRRLRSASTKCYLIRRRHGPPCMALASGNRMHFARFVAERQPSPRHLARLTRRQTEALQPDPPIRSGPALYSGCRQRYLRPPLCLVGPAPGARQTSGIPGQSAAAKPSQRCGTWPATQPPRPNQRRVSVGNSYSSIQRLRLQLPRHRPTAPNSQRRPFRSAQSRTAITCTCILSRLKTTLDHISRAACGFCTSITSRTGRLMLGPHMAG